MSITNYKWLIQSPVYVKFRKHYCPQCNVALHTTKNSRIVYPESEDMTTYRMNMMRSPNTIGPVKLIWTEFICPRCQRQFTIDEMKKIEGVAR